MYRVVILSVLFTAGTVLAQSASTPPATSLPTPLLLSSLPEASSSNSTAESPDQASAPAEALPDAPSQVLSQQEDAVAVGKASLHASGHDQKPCNIIGAFGMIYFDPKKTDEPPPRCSELVYPYQRFLNTNVVVPLTWKQKGYLAIHYTADPSSLGIIVGISAINIAADSHTAYGPGLKGVGELAGVSVLQNATAEFFGTFAVPALVHQDPRYYRMPGKPIGKRILYSITRSYISRSDEGKPIPNYSVFATYPIIAELGNLYVPGIQSDGASTAERILTGYALDPVNNIVNEFLPDLASHIHVRIIFIQQILNNIAYTNSGAL